MPPRSQTAGKTDTLKHRYGIPSLQAKRSQADQSENNVLLAFIMTCWRWLTSPTPAVAWTPSYLLERPAFAALPAMRPRILLLAPIHVPWRLRSSPPLA
jgi:hypothetical protein